MTAIIRARELGRWYGEVVGLNDLTVDIEAGVTGLIGPNGAGKSTFMKLLVGEIKASRGAVQVFGLEPFASRDLYRRLGFCPQQDALYDHMSGREFVRHCMQLAGFDKREADKRAIRALERVQMAEAMDRRAGGYSKGMRQRTKLAQSIAHEPELLVVDEPLSGLDPVSRHQTLELFRELGEAGTSIIVSSHVLHEVQSLTEEIVMIHRGRLLAQGTVPEVRRLISRHPRKVSIRAREPRRLAEAFLRFEHVKSLLLAEDGTELVVETRDVQSFFSELPALASDLRAGLQSLDSTDADLEAVFDYFGGVIVNTLVGTTWLMFRTHLFGVVRSKRALLGLLVACFPPFVAIFASEHEDAFEVVSILGIMTLQVVAPLIGLMAGSAVVTEEIENRTITYVFTRPVHRAALFLGRWMSTVVLTSALLGASAFAVVSIAQFERAGDVDGRTETHTTFTQDGTVERTSQTEEIDRALPAGLVGRYMWAAVLAGAVYSLMTAALGVFFRRPMIVGLGYAFAMEGLLANVPGSSQKLSVQYYLRGIFTDLGRAENDFLRDFEPIAETAFLTPAASSVRLLVVIAIAVCISSWTISRRQFVLTS